MDTISKTLAAEFTCKVLICILQSNPALIRMGEHV
jgi:hypothetical protein